MSLELFNLVDSYIKNPTNKNQSIIEDVLKKNPKLFYSINKDNYNIFQYVATGLSTGNGKSNVNVKILDILYKMFKYNTNKEVDSFLDSGKESSLHIAIYEQEYQIVRYLIEETKVNLNVKNFESQTPLFYCVNQDDLENCSTINKEIVKLLLFRGANVNILDKFNKTPLYYAVKNQCIPIIIMLLNADAKIIYTTNQNQKIDIRTKTTSIEIKHLLNKYLKKLSKPKKVNKHVTPIIKKYFHEYTFLCNHLDTINTDLLYILAHNLNVNTFSLSDTQICDKISTKIMNKMLINKIK
jgi:ankyrin repeat protein